MTHPLVDQLRFTRSEFRRSLAGTPPADAERRMEPMNSIGWIVGHMAWHEQLYWLTRAQGETPIPKLNDLVASGGPATTPALGEMLADLDAITAAADPWLDALAQADMSRLIAGPPGRPQRAIGSLIRRVTYHYWFHAGEILAIRQLFGHPDRPEFVGDLDGQAPYRPEPA